MQAILHRAIELHRGGPRCWISFRLRSSLPQRQEREVSVSQRNKFFGFLGVLLVIAAIYYFVSTDRTSDLVLIGTVDANQIVVSPKIMGLVERLAVDEGDQVKAGQT